MRFTVAIDGPAGSGKGTIATAVAARFGFAHLDTGLLYRAVGKKALDQGRGFIDQGVAALVARELRPQDLKRPGLRGAVAARAASKVAVLPEVRAALLDFQREFARQEGGAVLDGRDIGTVIYPEAEVKLYVVASLAKRAERRHRELAASGDEISLEQVQRDLESRDTRDAGRTDAPMKQADDAHLLDTSELSIDQAVAEAVNIIEQSLSRARS